MSIPMTAYWNQRAQDYDELFTRAPIRRRCMDEIRSRVPPGTQRVVDLGGGTGLLASALLADLPSVRCDLVDISPEMLDRARARLDATGRVTFHQTSFDALPLGDATVDAVVSTFALHHVDDLAKAAVAREIHRVLKPGGVVLLVDEIIFRSDLRRDPQALHARMLEVFYPQEGSEFGASRFADLEEWPTDPDSLLAAFRGAALDARIDPLEDIVGLLTARKPRSLEGALNAP